MTTLSVGEVATLAHGYTLDEVDKYARSAIRARRRYGNSDMSLGDQKEHAWFGVVECLYASEQRPEPLDLIRAGMDAIEGAVKEWLQAHGISADNGRQRPSYSRYWIGSTTGHVDFTDRLVERMALPEVLSQLTGDQYEAVAALAVHGSPAAAMEALGATRGAFHHRVQDARKVVLSLWFEHETPPLRTGRNHTDERCRYGHDRAEHSFRRGNSWVCRVCRRDATRRWRRKGSELEAEPKALAQADRPAAPGADGDPAEPLAG